LAACHFTESFTMRIGSLTALTLAALTATLPVSAQTAVKKPAESALSMLRIVCDSAANNAEVTINGVFKGECPVDVPVSEGTLKLRVVKQVDALRERAFAQDIRMAAGTVKRMDIELGPVQPNAKARRDEEERNKQQQALAEQRAAEERRIALERERLQAEAKAAQTQAAAILQSKAQAGDLASMLALAEQYYKVKEADSLKQAGIWFRKAADAGSPQGMGGVGGVLNSSKNPDRDEMQAVQWWRKGAEAGDGRSMAAMGVLYGTGSSGVTKDFKLAQELLFKASEKDNAFAMSTLGYGYDHGDLGLAPDPAEGLKWYRKAAELGDSGAMLNLGFAYETGRVGLTIDNQLALEWYRKAAELNNARAMNNIGAFAANGSGGLTQDPAAAAAWYRKAADLDDQIGQSNLGGMYMRGDGVPQSDQEALKWYRKAAANGHARAQGYVTLLEAKGVK